MGLGERLKAFKSLLFGKKVVEEKKKVEKVSIQREHEPHKGTKDAFQCKRDDCWCSQGRNPNHKPGIELRGPDAQLLEAAFNQSLSKRIASDREKTVGLTLYLDVMWKDVKKRKEEVMKDMAEDLSVVLEEASEGDIEVFGIERGKRDRRDKAQVYVNLHSLPLESELRAAMDDEESGFHKLKMLSLTEDMKSHEPHSKKVIAQLIDRGADVNVFDRSGITPLHYAARHLNVEQVKLLLDNDADPTIVDVYGNSPLHFAAITASTWKPAASDMVKSNSGKTSKGPCDTCGYTHTKNGKQVYNCELKISSQKLTELLKDGIKFKNTLGNTPAQSVMNEFTLKDIDQQVKKKLEDAPNPEILTAVEDIKASAERLHKVVAKFFQKKK